MRLELFPLPPRDPGLAQYPDEQLFPDITSVRVWYPHGNVTLDHELMPAAGVGAFKVKLSKVADQVISFDGA
jgi:hypothetical protein